MEEEKEKVDLDGLFVDVDWSTADPVAIENELEEELIELEKESLKNLAELGQKAANVVTLLNTAKNELGQTEDWLDFYSLQLSTMRQEMGQIEEINRTLQLQSKNQKLLLETLDALLPAIELPSSSLRRLREGNILAQDASLVDLEDAVQKIQSVLSHKLDDSLAGLMAVKERLDFYSKTADLFVNRFLEAMKSFMEAKSDEIRQDKSKHAKKGSLKLISHDTLYSALEKFKPLTLLLKELDPRQHLELQMIYQNVTSLLYQNEMIELIECIKAYHLQKRSEEEGAVTAGLSMVSHVFSSATTSNSPMHPGSPLSLVSPTRFGSLSQSPGSSKAQNAQPEWTPDQKLSLEQSIEMILSLLIPIMIKEKQFCMQFFYGRSTVGSNASSPNSSSNNQNEVKIQRRGNKFMEGIFGLLVEELNAFLDSSGRFDLLGCVDLLVGMEANFEAHCTAEADALTACLGPFQTKVRQAFGKFLEEQCQMIKDYGLSVKKRVGIVPFVASFPGFVQAMEKVTQGARAEQPSKQMVQLSYERLVKLIFDQFEKVEEEQDLESEKEKLNLCVLYIENYHHLFTQMRGLKVPILETYIKESKRRYEKYLKWYAKMSIQHALGKMIEFFDGIQNLLKTTPAEEINFHLSYNRANAKRVISQYPLREVKKSLELVHRRVLKHFCSEEGLQQVVWHTIQEELITRYHHCVSILQQCYPNSDVQLLFTVQEILEYFSEIAKVQ